MTGNTLLKDHNTGSLALISSCSTTMELDCQRRAFNKVLVREMFESSSGHLMLPLTELKHIDGHLSQSYQVLYKCLRGDTVAQWLALSP